MKHHDRDGKSKTASAVDAAHYSEHDEIAARAHELWIQRGRPEGSAERDWFDAVEQLRAKVNSHNSRAAAESGSVQH